MSDDERWIPTDPAVRAGIYASIVDVPDYLHLHVYEQEFKMKDVWTEFVAAAELLESSDSSSHHQYLKRAERRWMDFAEERGVHPALCHPSDAEVYAAHLFDNLDFGLSSAAKYWSSIERFYRWMFHHAEYPHRYSPFLIAAVNDDLCHHLWMHAIDKQ